MNERGQTTTEFALIAGIVALTFASVVTLRATFEHAVEQVEELGVEMCDPAITYRAPVTQFGRAALVSNCIPTVDEALEP